MIDMLLVVSAITLVLPFFIVVSIALGEVAADWIKDLFW